MVLFVIPVYRVSQSNPTEQGHATTYMQEYRGYSKNNILKPNHKILFLEDLEKWISK